MGATESDRPWDVGLKNVCFWTKKPLDPETDMDQFLDSETDIKHQVLDSETDKNVSFWIAVQKPILWISFWILKLTEETGELY